MSDSKLLTVSCRLWVDAILSADIPPTIELLVKELKDVTNWYVFGATLGVPVSTLNCIKSENSDVENKKIQMFQFWLQCKVDASWRWWFKHWSRTIISSWLQNWAKGICCLILRTPVMRSSKVCPVFIKHFLLTQSWDMLHSPNLIYAIWFYYTACTLLSCLMRKVSSHIFILFSIVIIEQSTNEEVNESTAEIRATAAVVERLRDLETSFTIMLTDINH